MGCIITKDPGYTPAANTPPVVLSHPDRPMDQFTVITVDQSEEPDGGVSSTVEFVATVYDPDTAQDLEGVVLLDYNADDPENRPIANVIGIPANGTTEREVSFSVQRTAFSERGCRVLSLHVSERFTNVILNPIPASIETPPDLGRGIWWLHVKADADDVINVNECAGGATP